MTKERMLREMSSQELTEWIALHAIRAEEAAERRRRH